MPEFNHDEVAPFELDYISLEFLRNHQTFRDLAGIAGVPEIRNVLWRGLPPHGFNHIGRCHRSRFGKTIQERSDAKKMVAMAVSDIDRGQVLAARRDPLYQRGSLLDRQKGVDKNGIPLTENERRRCGHPGPLLLARRQVAGDALAVCYQNVPLQRGTNGGTWHYVPPLHPVRR